MILERIKRAINRIELETMISIAPVEKQVALPFDMRLYLSFGKLQLPHRPVTRVIELAVRPQSSPDSPILVISPTWLDTRQLLTGQLNLIPWLASTSTAQTPVLLAPVMGSSGYLVSAFSSLPWVPSFWQVTYIAGFDGGRVPVSINELIGITASIDILSELQATNRIQNYSVGIDSANQSVNGGGSQVYALRIKDLEEKRVALTSRIRKKFGTLFFVSNV
jgi:hypothetical protein